MFPFLRSINDSLVVNVLVVLLFYYIPVNVHETNLYMKKKLKMVQSPTLKTISPKDPGTKNGATVPYNYNHLLP